ncbi:MAG TPA: hypothetical protein VHP83_25470 [Aggregatilineaceae bacterium]|nr:hypothetical protein [Aggregatilineaceae bacterium]
MIYHFDYEWYLDSKIPILLVTAVGDLLSDIQALAQMIDQAHYRAGQSEYPAVFILYDLTQTEGKISLIALMHRSLPSPNVRGVAFVGTRTRADEMAVLIQAAAKRLNYTSWFFKTRREALLGLQNTPFLYPFWTPSQIRVNPQDTV